MRTIFLIAALAIASIGLSAQTDLGNGIPVKEVKPYTLKLGPTIGLIAGTVATENAEGRKVNPDFIPLSSYGIAILAPFGAGSKMGMRLDLGVETISMRTRPYEFYGLKTNWVGFVEERYSHFTIAPVVNLSGFFIGAGFHIPMKGTITSSTGSTEYIVEKANLKTAIDLRLGGTIGVWHSNVGTLNVEIMASYYFSGLYVDDAYMYGRGTQAIGAPAKDYETGSNINNIPARMSIGLSYLFNLTF